jgi:predicted nucleic-acid-binding Zn-ribbon protein
MAGAPTHCPKCGGSIEQGFVADFTHGKSQSTQSEWVGGEPERSFWFGLKLKERTVLPIVAYRCGSCGYLEFYARRR